MINALENNGIYIVLIQKVDLMKMRFREIECFQFPWSAFMDVFFNSYYILAIRIDTSAATPRVIRWL